MPSPTPGSRSRRLVRRRETPGIPSTGLDRIRDQRADIDVEVPTVRVRSHCDCPPHKRQTLPFRMIADALPILRTALEGVLHPRSQIGTCKCRFCGGIAVVTAADLHLVVARADAADDLAAPALEDVA